MISTRRIAAVVGLAAGVTGLAAPMASAAPADILSHGPVNPVTLLDSLAVSDIPAQHKDEIPTAAEQMQQLNKLNDLSRLSELHQATDLVAPVTNLVPGIEA